MSATIDLWSSPESGTFFMCREEALNWGQTLNIDIISSSILLRWHLGEGGQIDWQSCDQDQLTEKSLICCDSSTADMRNIKSLDESLVL